MKFIKLTFFKFDKQYPHKSKCTNKEFWLNKDDISRFTEYKRPQHGSIETDSSTKLTLKSGDVIEVCEDLDTISKKLNKQL